MIGDFLSGVGITADITGVVAAIFALLAWIQSRRNHKHIVETERRNNEKVNLVIRLKDGEDQIRLPSSIRRADLNRQEILGRIGMIPMKNPQVRFALKYLNTPDFFEQLDRLQTASDSYEIVVFCDEDELAQFNRINSA